MSTGWYSILTPLQRAGAIAVILVEHPDPDSIGLAHPGINHLKLVDFHGIDQGVLMGLDRHRVLFMPHAGIAIVREVCARLNELGVVERPQIEPLEIYPEARSEIEAWCLHMLSMASSPRAVDVLLGHSERWHALGIETCAQGEVVDAMGTDCSLGHLLRPATVAAVGRANVGKSSLVNTLVGQQVALVSDVAGTTRDHVGVPVDLGGLVVRWVDTPGIDERIGDLDELDIACRMVAQADLVVHCIDSVEDDGVLDPRLATVIDPATPMLRLGTRGDRGEHACACDLRISVGEKSTGLSQLVERIGRLLVRDEDANDPRPWRFWACGLAER